MKSLADQPIFLIERAFELARSGHCANIVEVRKQLKRDGYPEPHIREHLVGRDIRGRISNICREAKPKPKPKR